MFLQPLFDKIKNEPAMVIAGIFIVGLTAYKVFGPEKMPLEEVFTEDYATYIGALVAGLLTRMNVFSPGSVEAEVEVALAEAAARRTAAHDDSEEL